MALYGSGGDKSVINVKFAFLKCGFLPHRSFEGGIMPVLKNKPY